MPTARQAASVLRNQEMGMPSPMDIDPSQREYEIMSSPRGGPVMLVHKKKKKKGEDDGSPEE